jgi:hypothetical protein
MARRTRLRQPEKGTPRGQLQSVIAVILSLEGVESRL